MSRVELRFLPSALELSLDRRRQLLQFCGTAAAVLLGELTAQLAMASGLSVPLGWLLALPFSYAIVMATGVLVCASCRHAMARRDPEGGAPAPFEIVPALSRTLLPSAAGSAVLFLGSGAVGLLVSLILAVGKLSTGIVLPALSILLIPLAALLSAALAVLALGLLLFPPLAAASGGDLDGLLAQFWRTLRTRFFHLLCQEVVAVALAVLFTGMLAAAIWGGQELLERLGSALFGEAFANVQSHGITGLICALEKRLLWSLAATPALVFLNAASYLILSTPSPEPEPLHFDEEEETWLQP